eukprot:COSAG02_NODE_54148_length_297_cov_1.484848_1_plen_81_part_10
MTPILKVLLCWNLIPLYVGDANNNLILFDTDTTASAGQGIGSVQFYGSDASGAGAGIKSEVKVFYAGDGDSSIMTFSTSDS